MDTDFTEDRLVAPGMDRATFNRFRRIVYDNCGISLGAQKEALVCARVGKRMRALGVRDHRSYLRYVMQDGSGEEMVHLLDAISTNVTSFFREEHHFSFLGDRVSAWAAQGQTRFRFWSAACSTGEEPYSMAMTLLDAPEASELSDIRILATDISTRALEKSEAGVYEWEKLTGLPRPIRGRYLEEQDGEPFFRVTEPVRRLIVFRRLNLAATPYPMRGPLDIIFCRNVMIYFDNEVRRRVLTEMYRLLKPGGYLIVGHAESLTGMMSRFRAVQPSIYVK